MPNTGGATAAAVSASAAGLSIFGIATGLHVELLLAGLAGALFSLSFDQPEPRFRRALVTLSAAVVAAYITPLSVALVQINYPLPESITREILLPASAVAIGFLARRLIGPAAFKIADKILEKM